ncbi:Bud site selection protein 6 [Cyphellophora attinorum]|uniref:Bud site selection protein 6 n=1 Tax=Cyphellophora attinorum TaxID=1664694 RepID=A0A0N0NKD2_9EURO|nr:Bud site selection protein 6 [Phialophora attinorum]KPI37898.1 Bud site selection protein 6 [Phialophora attinorum]
MQSSTIPRQYQPPRRQQTVPEREPPEPAINTMSASASTSQVPQGRTSSGSGRSQKNANPDKQISQIEKSVTHLLVATKQLLETLTQWSRGQAQEEEVSDVYVRLGYEFNLACRAFNSIGVETADLGNVPDLLRHILEDTLSQPASPQALDNYLPRIRDIIITLLHGLKRKQSKLRGKGSKDSTGSAGGRAPPVRNASLASSASNETGITQMLEGVPSTQSPARAGSPSSSHSRDQSGDGDYNTWSANSASGSLSRGSVNRHSMRREPSIPQSDTDSTLSSATAQNIPVQPPFEANVRPPSEVNFPHPPPPPPKQTDALAQLQRGGDLERRASRRFSAYQISKHLGASPNGIPIPPTQNSPIPNRGREVRESMTAVRSRTSQYRKQPQQKLDPSPSRSGTIKAPETISEEEPALSTSLSSGNFPKVTPPDEAGDDDSPIAKTPDEYHKPRSPQDKRDAPILSATLNGPMSPPDSVLSANFPTPQDEKPEHEFEPEKRADDDAVAVEQKTRDVMTPPPIQTTDLNSSPPQGKDLTLFLQYRSKIKKFVLPEGYEELTFARLQLAFIEKFSWNTNETGLELPEIYIQDPVSGVRHELEDLSDVKDRSVLVLNIEALDEVKKHFDEGMSGITQTLNAFKLQLESQGNMMTRFSDRQLEASKEMARMSALPSVLTPKPSSSTPATNNKTSNVASSHASLQEVQSLRRDIAILRQTYGSMSSDFSSAMTEIRAKAANLSSETETLINRVDDLADIVEELRKDVVTRGVRPLPRQLEGVSKEISGTMKELVKLKDFVKREKPIWTKIWEQELKMVMSERDDLTQRDEIIADLDGDLKDVTDIFSLVEEATKQQNLQAQQQGGASVIGPSGLRSTSGRNLSFETGDVDPHEAKSGMLDEVRALEPNHESRLEAIERAERARQKELQSRKGGAFQQEVENFVEEGKLKKTGGVEEIERQRRIKDEKAQRENWETMERQRVEVEERRLKRQMEKQAREDARRQQQQAEAEAQAGGEGGEGGQQQQQQQEDANDTSQEGEAVFEDAKEVPSSTSGGDLKGAAEGGGGGGPPTLPEIETSATGEAGKSGTSFLEDSDRE